MSLSIEQLVERIHASPRRIVLAVSGGGSRAISELLGVPGASRTVLEAVVPYCDEAMAALIGGTPEGACSPKTARAMALAAFLRASRYNCQSSPAGVACTAALSSDRPKRGPHRIHVAMQTVSSAATWSLQLNKGRRSRADEERLACRLVLGAVAEACGVDQRPKLDLFEG